MLPHKCNLYPVTNNAARYLTKRFRNLPARPFNCGMRRHIEVNSVTSMVRNTTKTNNKHDQEINRHQLLDVVVKKSAPGLRGWLSLTHYVLGYRCLRDLYS
jgi:hypothetical protein